MTEISSKRSTLSLQVAVTLCILCGLYSANCFCQWRSRQPKAPTHCKSRVLRSAAEGRLVEVPKKDTYKIGQEVVLLAPAALSGQRGVIVTPVPGNAYAVRLRSGSSFHIKVENIQAAACPPEATSGGDGGGFGSFGGSGTGRNGDGQPPGDTWTSSGEGEPTSNESGFWKILFFIGFVAVAAYSLRKLRQLQSKKTSRYLPRRVDTLPALSMGSFDVKLFIALLCLALAILQRFGDVSDELLTWIESGGIIPKVLVWFRGLLISKVPSEVTKGRSHTWEGADILEAVNPLKKTDLMPAANPFARWDAKCFCLALTVVGFLAVFLRAGKKKKSGTRAAQGTAWGSGRGVVGDADDTDSLTAEKCEQEHPEHVLKYEEITLKDIDQVLFIGQLRRRLAESGISSSQSRSVEIELREGSVYAIMRGAVEVLGTIKRIDPQDLVVFGCVPEVVPPAKQPTWGSAKSSSVEQERDQDDPVMQAELARLQAVAEARQQREKADKLFAERPDCQETAAVLEQLQSSQAMLSAAEAHRDAVEVLLADRSEVARLANAARASAEAERESLEKQLGEIQDALANKSTAEEQRQQEIVAMQAELDRLQSLNASTTAEVERNREKAASMSAEKDMLKNELDELRRVLDAKSAAAGELQQETASLQAELDRLQSCHASAAEAAKEHNEHIETVFADKIRACDETLSTANAERETLQNELNNSLAQQLAAEKKHQQESAEIFGQLQSSRVALSAAESQRDEAERLLAERSEILSTAETEKVSLQKQLEETKRCLAIKSAAEGGQQHECAGLQADLDGMQSVNASAVAVAQEHRARAEKRLADKSEALDEANADRDMLQSELQSTKTTFILRLAAEEEHQQETAAMLGELQCSYAVLSATADANREKAEQFFAERSQAELQTSEVGSAATAERVSLQKELLEMKYEFARRSILDEEQNNLQTERLLADRSETCDAAIATVNAQRETLQNELEETKKTLAHQGLLEHEQQQEAAAMLEKLQSSHAALSEGAQEQWEKSETFMAERTEAAKEAITALSEANADRAALRTELAQARQSLASSLAPEAGRQQETSAMLEELQFALASAETKTGELSEKVRNLHVERSEAARQTEQALSAASAESYELQSELGEMKEELALKQTEECRQKEAAGLQQGELQRLQLSCASAVAEAERHQEKADMLLAEKSEAARKAQEAMSTITEQKVALQNELEEMRARADKTSSSASREVSGDATAGNLDLAAKQAEIDRLQISHASGEAEMKKLLAAWSEATRESTEAMAAANSEKDLLQGELEKAKAELDRLRTSAAAVDAEERSKQDDKERADEALRAELEEMKQTLASKSAAEQAQKQETAAMEAQLERLQSSHSLAHEAVSAVNAEKGMLQEELESMRTWQASFGMEQKDPCPWNRNTSSGPSGLRSDVSNTHAPPSSVASFSSECTGGATQALRPDVDMNRLTSLSTFEQLLDTDELLKLRQEIDRPARYGARHLSTPIVVVSSEINPWSKTGGLAMVASSYAYEFAIRGHRTMAIAPYYEEYRDCQKVGSAKVWLNGRENEVHYYLHRQDFGEGKGCDYIFVDHPSYRRSQGLYGDPLRGGEYDDNCFRFTLLSLAATEAPLVLNLGGSVYGQEVCFISNDWQTGMLPVYLLYKYRRNRTYQKARCIMVLHNLGYQGKYQKSLLPIEEFFGLPPEAAADMSGEDPRFGHDCINLLGAGIKLADSVLTVSPNYSREIQTPDGGAGLQGFLREKAYNKRLRGILNGISDEWNPMLDPHIAMAYGEENFEEGKHHCKAALQRELGLVEDPDLCLIGFCGRLCHQKGIHLILESLPWLMNNEGNNVNGFAQVVFMGKGEPTFEKQLREVDASYPGRLCSYVGFDPHLEHRMLAGCDILLMPSQYEPCGLPQMYAQQYATLPVVHETGGLKDSVKGLWDLHRDASIATGFLFQGFSCDKFKERLYAAMHIFHFRKALWQQLQGNAIREDFYWPQAIDEYEKVIDKVMESAPCCQ